MTSSEIATVYVDRETWRKLREEAVVVSQSIVDALSFEDILKQ